MLFNAKLKVSAARRRLTERACRRAQIIIIAIRKKRVETGAEVAKRQHNTGVVSAPQTATSLTEEPLLSFWRQTHMVRRDDACSMQPSREGCMDGKERCEWSLPERLAANIQKPGWGVKTPTSSDWLIGLIKMTGGNKWRALQGSYRNTAHEYQWMSCYYISRVQVH